MRSPTRLPRSRPTSLFAWVALALALAAPAHAETILIGPADLPMALADALAKARDGDTIEIMPGTYKGQVGIVTQRRLTIRGGEPRPVLEADGRYAEGKAALVVRGGEVTIENIEFRGNRVPDGNGAGIRFETGKLLVRRCRFADNQTGLLTGNDNDAELIVEDSEFSQAPRVEGSLPHLLYAGRVARLTVTGSRFHTGFEGHMIKSRARETRLAYNLIVDGPAGGASYEIDLPNGGDAVLVGNIVGQGRRTQNPVVVAYGAEGRAWDTNRLLLSHNTLVSDFPLAWFLRSWPDKLGPGTQIRAVNNLTVGLGVFWLGSAGEFDGNASASRGTMGDAAMLAFELARDSGERGSAADPATLAGDEARPTAEFALPIGTKPLKTPAAWSPGALQR